VGAPSSGGVAVKRTITIDQAMRDRNLLGAALGETASWSTWRTVLKAAFALQLDAEEMEIFTAIAGGRALPRARVRELWVLAGRRGGKSRMAGLIAVYIAVFVKHKLAPGEIGAVLVLAAATDQAKTIFNYAKAFLQSSPVLRQEIEAITATEIRLRCGIEIIIRANSFRTTRSRTLVAAIFDEASFWRSEDSSTPDVETYSAVLPSLATVNGMLVSISSAYRRVGMMYAKHRDYFGVDSDDTLVVQIERYAPGNLVK
jgi:phage terminase large subunit-like protein